MAQHAAVVLAMMFDEWLVPSVTILLAAVAGFVAGLLRDRVQRQDLRQKTELDLTRQLVAESISGAQWCGSIFSHLSTLGIDRRGLDKPEHSRTRNDIGEAVSKWNTAMYQLYVIADRDLVAHLRGIDQEISSLYERSLDPTNSDTADVQNRSRLGELLAAYVDEARRQLSRSGPDLEPLGLNSLWSWSGKRTGPE